jgi:hypothetical protein
MNCDAVPSFFLLGRATTVTRDPTAIPHGSSTATGVLASRSVGTETVAGQDAEADGEGEGAEEEEERRCGRSGAAAAKAEAAEDSIEEEAEELERRGKRMEERAKRERRGGTGDGKVWVSGRSGAAVEEERSEAASSSRRRGRWVATGETETVGSSRKRRKSRYAAAAESRKARRHARFGGMAVAGRATAKKQSWRWSEREGE